MFETAELGRSLDKSSYETEVPELRTSLLKAQTALGHARFPVIVLLHGEDPVGAQDVFNLLHEWLDARYVVGQAWEPLEPPERERPAYFRYWNWLPPARRIGVFLGSWYTKPLWARIRDRIDDHEYEGALDRAVSFERTLAEDGALFVKLWLHVTREAQLRRFDELERSGKMSRLSRRDRRYRSHYGEVVRLGARTVTATSTEHAPWTVVEANDWRYRNVTLGRAIAQAIDERLAAAWPTASGKPTNEPVSDPITILDRLDLGKKLGEDEYRARLEQAQAELAALSRKLERRRQSLIVVFEGWDAAGKGGAIRRITHALDARLYRIIPVSAPTPEERSHHYLWRFWRELPRRGRVTIYDRSWYGRVLVERVEGFASEPEWRRAYREINDFEKQLTEGRAMVVKFWLHISKDEQLRRFEARKREPWKQYKLTDEDYRNREKTNEYEAAANEMIARTDTEYAPWTLVEAEDKAFSRVKVLETLAERLKKAT
jgi:polyphosphate:AMP phosphotransferase